LKEIDQNTSTEEIQALLESLNWIANEKIIHVSVPGEGNMNVVLRVTSDRRSFILKQSRPYVNKYPTLEAPISRIDTEYQYYTALSSDGPNEMMPEILAYDADHHLLMMKDLGDCRDMSFLYQKRKISEPQVSALVQMLSEIHSSTVPPGYPDNLELRRLNHQHIFELPFLEENGFGLDDAQAGLQELSMPYKTNEKLKSIVSELGVRYLAQGSTLLHGDYYPGSWMQAGDRVYVIDPEFSFAGPAEFDLGVMAAHLMMINSDESNLSVIREQYPHDIDSGLLSRFAGVEIIRRLIGLAQLPLERSLSEKAELLTIAEKLLMR
jgi:5-methylthioribose kinase